MNTFDKIFVVVLIVIGIVIYAGFKFFSNPDSFR